MQTSGDSVKEAERDRKVKKRKRGMIRRHPIIAALGFIGFGSYALLYIRGLVVPWGASAGPWLLANTRIGSVTAGDGAQYVLYANHPGILSRGNVHFWVVGSHFLGRSVVGNGFLDEDTVLAGMPPVFTVENANELCVGGVEGRKNNAPKLYRFLPR